VCPGCSKSPLRECPVFSCKVAVFLGWVDLGVTLLRKSWSGGCRISRLRLGCFRIHLDIFRRDFCMFLKIFLFNGM